MAHEMSVQSPEMFWCTVDDRMEWLFNFNAYKLAQEGLAVFFYYYYLFLVSFSK